MSNTEARDALSRSGDCPPRPEQPVSQRLPARVTVLGESMIIRRALPHRQRRMIGAWCFLDHAGPVDVHEGLGMRVGPHPHTGLQTFTWMVDGEIFHRDSLGYEQLIRAGQVNLMTAGRGISHSEESPAERSPTLQAAQLWIALPKDQCDIEPAFDHYPELPQHVQDGVTCTLLVGEAFAKQSPARVYSPLVGVDLRAASQTEISLPLRTDFEYGVLVLTGAIEIEGEPLAPGELLYLGQGRDLLRIRFPAAAQVLLIGGEPFAEDIVLWWNFIGRSQEDIERYTQWWNQGEHFGAVKGYNGDRLSAPELPARLRPTS